MAADRPTPTIDRRTAWGLGSCALLVLGSVTPWATAGPFTKNGLEGDGVITLVLAVLVAALILLRRAPVVALVLAAIALVITIIDTADVSSVDGAAFLDVSVGWGLIVALVASISLVAWAVVGLRDARRGAARGA